MSQWTVKIANIATHPFVVRLGSGLILFGCGFLANKSDQAKRLEDANEKIKKYDEAFTEMEATHLKLVAQVQKSLTDNVRLLVDNKELEKRANQCEKIEKNLKLCQTHPFFFKMVSNSTVAANDTKEEQKNMSPK